jgi:2-polyprenyl-6-methoxyphenol hydroxylase-like FAD-dependent oxidoreductase
MGAGRALVIGGSVAGLLCALLLRRQGWAVSVHERVLGDLAGRGAGLGVSQELLDVMARAGAPFAPSAGVRSARTSGWRRMAPSALSTAATSWRALLVAADGALSTVRRQYLAGIEPAFAGYVAWRGLVKERDMPPDTLAAVEGRLVFCFAPGEMLLCIVAPGAGEETRPGERRLYFT